MLASLWVQRGFWRWPRQASRSKAQSSRKRWRSMKVACVWTTQTIMDANCASRNPTRLYKQWRIKLAGRGAAAGAGRTSSRTRRERRGAAAACRSAEADPGGRCGWRGRMFVALASGLAKTTAHARQAFTALGGTDKAADGLVSATWYVRVNTKPRPVVAGDRRVAFVGWGSPSARAGAGRVAGRRGDAVDRLSAGTVSPLPRDQRSRLCGVGAVAWPRLRIRRCRDSRGA